MKRVLKYFLLTILVLLFIFVGYLFIGHAKRPTQINWGITFSQKHAQNLGFNWQESYQALLDGLKVKRVKLISHWDLLEPENDNYFFEDLDWQIKEAERRGVKILLVIGMKTGRWPECHLPDWAWELDQKGLEKEILEIIKETVLRYKEKDSILAWQVENEPLFPFGQCPKIEKKFLREEIKLVKSLDERPVVITDSGEFSFWLNAARFGDIVGTTLHRKVYFKELGIYISYPFPPVYYWRRAKLIEKIFAKKVINVELQAEPWCQTLLYYCPQKEQKKTMDLKQFRKNLDFAQKTGFDTFYFWGAEWWYWLKEKQNQPEIWNETKKYFK